VTTYRNAGWAGKGWVINDGQDYPHLAWENVGGIPIPESEPVPLLGSGTIEDPYQIWTPDNFALLSWHSSILDKHISLMSDLELSGIKLYPIGDLGRFIGVFDGKSHVIRHAVIEQPGSDYVGLFSYMYQNGQICNLGAEDIAIAGREHVGGLVGGNIRGSLTACHTTGLVSGIGSVGGLAGHSWVGYLAACYATSSVNGDFFVGGLVGDSTDSNLATCYATGSVRGDDYVGGLVGDNLGCLAGCYATGDVNGTGWYIGGLVGHNWGGGSLIDCYATGSVNGDSYVGGLVGENKSGSLKHCYAIGFVTGNETISVGGMVGDNSLGDITACFWDAETSGWTTSAGGIGKTTAEMKTKSTFTNAGWDFVGEMINGTDDTWSICEGTNYPRLTWQIPEADWLCPDGVGMEDFGYLAEAWMIAEVGGSPIDLDGDNSIDARDLMMLCEQWLTGR